MKKKLFGLTILFASLFGFVGCLDDDEPVWYFYNEPAIVQYSNSKPMLKTAYGRFYVPNLSDTLKTGDHLWASFTVDFNSQPNAGDTTAVGLSYIKIMDHATDNSVIIKAGDMVDTYNDSITTAKLYNSVIGNVLFFGFDQSAPKGQTYKYEIICNTDSVVVKDGKEWPVLFIRSVKANSPSGDPTTVSSAFGFDMSKFVSKYKDSNDNVLLYIKYKNGTRKGEDSYKSFQTFPITWRVK